MKHPVYFLTAVVSAVLGVMLFLKTSQFDQLGHVRFDAGLRQLKHVDTTFSEEVLKVRFKLVDSYDEFSVFEKDLTERALELKHLPKFLEEDERKRLLNLVNDYSALLDQRLELFEAFQSQNAVLNNSLNYFPTTGEELMAGLCADKSSRELQNRMNDFLRELLAYGFKPDDDPAAVQREIAWASNWAEENSNHPAAALVSSLSLHARTILNRKPMVEQLTRDLIALPTGEKLEQISQAYQTGLGHALRRAGIYRALLWAVCLLCVVSVACTLVALRSNNRALETRVGERTEELSCANSELKAEMAERRKVESEIVRVSRLAGMAEVATSVLHNVGNVLNSINVSASLVSDQLRQSKTGNLSKVVALLDEHAMDLGEYITKDPKGRQVPGYLGNLTKHLAAEKASLLEEVNSLTKNIDHIKEIVATQQSFAKCSGVTETINTSELLEDAIRMVDVAFVRHKVSLIREFGECPPEVTIDKHKALQILVNLLRNAKQSCNEANPPEKRLTMSITKGVGQVRLSVQDNGMGISAENLNRIFNHGFTTKKDGHGFGLHASALAARELGGALNVQSDGVGEGATFTLELPCA